MSNIYKASTGGGGGSGTVTSVSVVTANGLAGTVANPTTTPAITLSTTATGVLSGNGTTISGSPVTLHSVLVGGASNSITSLTAGTTGQVLTGVTGSDPIFAAPAASSISIAGDSGSITGGSLTIFANRVSNSTGSSVSFTNSGTTSTFSLVDPSNNMFLGFNAGNLTVSGTSNVIIGPNSGFTLSTGAINTGIGDSNFSFLTAGIGNIGIGRRSGFQYTTSESYNILIGNQGSTGESNVIRIGDQGAGSFQQNKAFMAGIVGVTVSNAVPVMIDSTTGQLGVGTPVSGGIVDITGDSGGAQTGPSITLTGGSTGLTFDGATNTETLGGTLVLANGGTSASLTASNGGVFYSTATAGAILAGTATAGRIIRSGASAAPSWSTSTYPATNAVNTLLYASSANVMSALATGNNGVLITSATGVPSLLAPGTTGQVLTATTGSPPSWVSPPSDPITSIVTQVFTTSGTWTATAGMVYAEIIIVSGGGGGGSADATLGGGGGGGGAGGLSSAIFPVAVIGTTQSVVVGTGGAGGTGGADGAVGLQSSVTGSSLGSQPGFGGSASNVFANGFGSGGGGGGASGGSVNIEGGSGTTGLYFSGLLSIGGMGGYNRYGGPATAAIATGGASIGLPGVGFGGGGAGGAAAPLGSGADGGAGSDGVVYIIEYIS